MNDKLATITNLFEGKEIRSIWDSEKEEYYFSVVDVINALAEPKDASDYWTTLKRRMIKEEKSEIPTNCRELKMKSPKDGKMYKTDTLDTTDIFRLIESIPSKKAEPFKLWLANLGKERVDEVFDPEIAVNRAIEYYRKRGYTDDWIKKRLLGILNRKKLTDIWKDGGITQDFEYGILTNEIYKEWSGMTAKQYKGFKGLRKESLRDNMSEIEVALADIGEIATRELAKTYKPYGLKENKKIAKLGGNTAKVTKDDLENKLGKPIITNKNSLNYKYLDKK